MPIIQYIRAPLKSFYELNFWHTILAILKATVLFLISITTVCVIVIAAYFVISPSYRESVLDKLGADRYTSQGLDPARFSAGSSEDDYDPVDFQTVLPDQKAVSRWVLNCLGVDPERPAFAIYAALVTDRFQRRMSPQEWPKDVKHFDADENADHPVEQTPYGPAIRFNGESQIGLFFLGDCNACNDYSRDDYDDIG